VTPGVLVLVTARAVDPTVDPDTVVDRAAGVQLIYEGLRLTRSVAHEEPWVTAATQESDIDADMDVLTADVLVARGFALLACTDAAAAAVEVARARSTATRRSESARGPTPPRRPRSTGTWRSTLSNSPSSPAPPRSAATRPKSC